MAELARLRRISNGNGEICNPPNGTGSTLDRGPGHHKGATAKAAALKVWLAGLITAYEDKILGVEPLVATISGRMEAKAISSGHDPGMADATIAGIAKTHDLVVVTRNTKHFLPFDIEVVTPDEAAGRLS